MRWPHRQAAAAAHGDHAAQPPNGKGGEPQLVATLETRDQKPGREMFEDPPTLERWDRVESRWNLGSALVMVAGAALAVLGAAAAVRTGVNDTWFSPVAEVAGIRHTQLLAAVEAGVGLLLVIAGLAGAPGLAAFVCISGAMAAGVAALEPGLVSEQVAAERWWFVALALTGAGLAFLAMVPWPHFVERHYTSETSVARSHRRRTAPWPGLVS